MQAYGATVRMVMAVGAVLLGVSLVAGCSSGDDSGGGDSGGDGAGAGDGTTVPDGAASTTAGDGSSTTSASTSGGQSGELSILTYNVAGLPQEISEVNPEDNLPLISPLIEEYDIVMTQEDFDWWSDAVNELDFVNYHTRLRADVTYPYQTEQHPGPAAVGIDGADPDRPDPLVGDGLGFLSRHPFHDVDRVPWTHCFGGADTSQGGAGDCLAMKGFMVATFELADGVEVDMYTLHGEAGSTPEDDAFQADDYVQLAAYIDEHSADRAVIIGGDTNLHTLDDDDAEVDGASWQQMLDATGLTDVCDVVDCEQPGTIDKFAFASRGGVTLEPIERRWEDDTFVDASGDDLSDHPPVMTRWRWSAP